MRQLYFCLLIHVVFVFSGHSQETFAGELQWRNIGPANQGGRIVDIEALNDDFTRVIMATGSGGVWKSENAGISWTPIFDNYETASIGDIAIDQANPEVIWVGTGEANNRNSVSWGNGVYKSTDGGVTFENVGLKETHQIARISINPENGDDVCICAIGHLWGTSGTRGIFRTTDGGKNWKLLGGGLPDDGKTGCNDLVRDPNHPEILYAAFYERLRKPWHFESGGMNGGIFKTTDNGETWIKLMNGLPEAPTGRIGLDIYQANPNIIMAFIEAKASRSLSNPGSGVYRSEDAGRSWKYVNTYNNRPFYYSQIRINPKDDQRVYLMTTRFMVSEDGGKTFVNGSEDQEVHGDFHAMWIDPIDKDRYYLGADKGLSLTHDHGAHFQLFDNLPIGQFYSIQFDMRDPYYVYGGLQDNGSFATASFSRDARGILNDVNWKMHWGDGQSPLVNPANWRDMYTSTENGGIFKYDPRTRQLIRIVPSPSNTLNYYQYFSNRDTNLSSSIRFNWSAAFVMSPQDANTLYLGGNYLYKTVNGGQSWEIISPDLSSNDPEKRQSGKSGGVTPDNTGAETHCSLTSISLSSIDAQLIWIGTDDGNIQLTRDGGKNWVNLRSNIPEVPENLWVSKVEASHFDVATAYVSFDGHRSDHNRPYIFRTNDFGQTWEKIVNGFPEDEVIRVVIEDLLSPDLLFAGSETGVWYSSNAGKEWFSLRNNMPTVSVYDLKIHPRDHDLIAGTHGRSIWIMDDIRPLRYTLADDREMMKLPPQSVATIWENTSRGGQRGHFWFAGKNPPEIINTSSLPRAQFESGAVINYIINRDLKGCTLKISSLDGSAEVEIPVDSSKGIHRIVWNMEFESKEFTRAQKTVIDKMFKDWIAKYGTNQLEDLKNRFDRAKTIRDKREILTGLTQGFTSFTIPEDLLLPKAGPGVYRLSLLSGNHKITATLQIRKDPLAED